MAARTTANRRFDGAATKPRTGGGGASGRRGDTAERILDVAESHVQQRGFNAFSYADVASELEISKASVHHHFAGKAELGEALISRYSRRFATSLAAIDERRADAPAKLRAYVRLYADVLRDRRMCLCGMLAAEYQALPPAMGRALIAFFDDNEAWLTGVLHGGRREHTLSFQGSPRDTARALISGLEGAMLVARPYDDVDRFQLTAAGMVRNLLRPHTTAPSSV